MKGLIKLLLLTLLTPLAALAQNGTTTVQAIVKDPTGALYVSSQVGASFFDPGTSGKLPLLNGSTFQKSFTGYGTDSFGFFTLTLPDNGIIDSSSGTINTQWNFTICYKDRQTCFTYKTAINCAANIPTTCTNSLIDISALLQAVAALIPSTGPGGGSPAQGPLYTLQASNGAGQFQVTTITDNVSLGLVTIGDNVSLSGNLTGLGTLAITGASTLNGVLTVNNTALITGKATIGGDLQVAGPGPVGADVRGYGKFATGSSATATTTSGSAVIPISSSSNFKNGEYATIFNAGTACALATPGIPTVTPSVSASGINTVPAGAGGSSFAYKVIAADKFGCYTPASVSGSTATGNTLGLQIATITTITRANNVTTVNTSAAHGYVPGEKIHIRYFTTSDPSFEGFWIVATVPTSTSFTYVSNFDTRTGAVTSGTGGTIYGFNVNTVTWTAVPNAWKYYIYGRTGGAFTLIAKTMLNFWADYGSAMNDPGQVYPPFIPTTAPVTGANDHLTAKINSGGGTTSLTLASPAGASVSATIQSDDGPALIAAANSGTLNVYIPLQGITVNSYTLLPAGARDIKLGGSITANDTIEFATGTYVEGQAVTSASSFTWGSYPYISTNGAAYPLLYLNNGFSANRVAIRCVALNGCLSIYSGLNANNMTFSFVDHLIGNGGSANALGLHAMFATGGFGYHFSHNLFSGDPYGPNDNTNIGNTPVPTMLFIPNSSTGTPQNTSDILVENSDFLGRASFDEDTNTSGSVLVRFQAKNILMQSMQMPPFEFSGVGGGLISANTTFDSTLSADFATANLFLSAPNITFSGFRFSNLGVGVGGRSLVTGQPILAATQTGSGGGVSSNYLNLGSQPNAPAIATDGVIQATSMGFPMTAPNVAPGAVVSAGGSSIIGNFPYTVQFLDANGFFSAVSPSTNANTTLGNQTVTITRPTPPSGAVSWHPSVNGARIFCSPIPVATTTAVYNSSACGGVNAPALANSISLGAAGVVTPILNLTNNGFFTTFDFPTPLTLNRLIHVPNSSGTLAFTDLTQTYTAKQTFANISLTFEDFPLQATPGNPPAGNIRVYGDNGSGNLTCLTSAGANCLPTGGGGGTPGGSTTQVQINITGAFAGSPCMTFVSPALSLGVAGTCTGILNLAGTTSGVVSIQSQAVAGTYNFNLPTSAGSSGQPLQSGGGAGAPMTFGTLTVPGGGSGAVTFTANSLLAGNGASPFQVAVGSIIAASPILTLKSPTASGVALTLDTAATPSGDILRIQVNTVKTSWFDFNGFLNTPQTTYTGPGALTLSGTLASCPGTLAGTAILCLGDVATSMALLSNNGNSFKPVAQLVNATPIAHSVAMSSTTTPQLESSASAGIVGQAFLSGGPAAAGNYGVFNLAGGVNILSGVLPVINGGTGATSLSGANIITVTGAVVVGHCPQFQAATVIQDSGGVCVGAGGAPSLNSITAMTSSNTPINNASFAESMNWTLTGSTIGFKIGEAGAATGAGNTSFQVSTLNTSTATVVQFDNNGNGVKMSSTGAFAPFGTGTNSANVLNSLLSVNGITTAGVGIPFILGTVSNITNQSTSQGSVTIATAPAAAPYAIVYYASQNGVCTTGANSVAFTFNWTDAGNARTLNTGNLVLGTAQAVSGYLSGLIPIFNNSGNVTYTSTVSGACASGTSSYDIHASIMRVQ